MCQYEVTNLPMTGWRISIRMGGEEGRMLEDFKLRWDLGIRGSEHPLINRIGRGWTMAWYL